MSSEELVSPFDDGILERYKIDRSLDNTSRYRTLFRLRDDEYREYIESWDNIDIPLSTDDLYYQVPIAYTHRIDLISFKFYRTVKLWWCIALASRLDDPLDIPLDTVLTVPSRFRLFSLGLIG